MANNAVSDIIVTVGKKEKFFDMRNALNLAYVEDYAMIHGCGGAKHASTSGIMLTITDYSGGTGEKSTFVHGIVPPHIIDKMLAVCHQNAGTRVDGSADLAAAATVMNAKLDRILSGLLTGVAKGVAACGNIIKGAGHERGPIADLGQVVLAARNAIANKEADVQNFGIREPYTDFTYHQERVNTYRRDPKDGFVFVSVVDIARKQFNDKGDLRRLPWQIKIKNLYAPPIDQPNGTTAYSSGNARDVSECFVQVSDDEMLQCCYAVDHFIRVWEDANAIPLVLEGLQRRKQARQNNG